MAKGYTLDTRPWLYGEKRLSDAQVRLLRKCSRSPNGTAEFERPGTAGALVDGHLAQWCPGRPRIVTITERGRKILAAIDAAAQREARP